MLLTCYTGFNFQKSDLFVASDLAGSTSDKLQQVELLAISDSQCQNYLKVESWLDSIMMCAGYAQGGKDACAVSQ